MPIAAIFWLLENIRQSIEREFIKYIYIIIYILLRISIYSLFSRENWYQGLWSLFFMQLIVDLFTFSC